MQSPNVMKNELKSVDWKEVLFSTKGRLNRKPYWIYSLILGVPAVVVSLIATAVGLRMVGMLVYLILCIPIVIMAIKRLHDCNRSGWFLLLMLVPLVNLWPAIQICFLRGTVGENKFGSDPLA